jgi:transaldolase / glucose-6-phosphate isomerase
VSTPDPDRWGWRNAPEKSLMEWPRWEEFAARAKADGLTHTVVCGMGGSSLAPWVLASSFGARNLTVLDSTDPAAVRAVEHWSDPAHTLYVIASKSGTTVESLAACHHFFRLAPASHFVAITDPGTSLEHRARLERWRKVFAHPADVGGRYAALTVVGMLPLALIGGPGADLLAGALSVRESDARELGNQIATAAGEGRDKLAFRAAPAAPHAAAVGAWIEQLVAESSGKNGKGVIPVPGPAWGGKDVYTVDAGTLDPIELGAHFLMWEYATVALCEGLGVNPFDQPDVEAAKVLARAELARSAAAADLPQTLSPKGLSSSARRGDYVAVLTYLPQTPANDARLAALAGLWTGATGCVVTTGYGPRYLHSTGQLHKGGPNTGLFLVVTADPDQDIEIPEMRTTFGKLERAQALGDIKALLAKARRVSHVHLRDPEDWSGLAPA